MMVNETPHSVRMRLANLIENQEFGLNDQDMRLMKMFRCTISMLNEVK